jgi:hypothetical protein
MEVNQSSHEASFAHHRRAATRWGAAALAGLIVGGLFYLFPRGIPWTSVTAFSAAVMGRVMPAEVPYATAILLHAVVSALYGLAIGCAVNRLRRPEYALLVGAAVGLGLYLLNSGVVYLFFHWAYGREPAIIVTHLLFGAFTAAAYRGIAGRRREELPTESQDV